MVSPDGKTLLVLTSGYNRVYTTDVTADHTPSWTYVGLERVRVRLRHFDVHAGQEAGRCRVANTYHGIVFDPSGTAFYVSGGHE